MALTDFLGQSTNLFNNGDPQEQNLDLGVLSQIVNSQPQAQPQQAPAQTQEAPAQESGGVGGFLKGIADGLAGAFSNPETINALQAFGAGMSGDARAQAQYTNAYSQRVAERKDQERQDIYRKEQQRIAEQNAQRQSQTQFTSQLFKQYSPESVQAFQQSGDYSVLKPIQKAASYSSAGDGYILNSATGEVSRGYVPERKGSGGGNGGSGSGGTSVGSAVDSDGVSRQAQRGTDGNWYIPKIGSKGQFLGMVLAGPQQQKQLNATETAGQPSAQDNLIYQNLNSLQSADSKQLEPFTGQIDQFLPDSVKQFQSTYAGGSSNELRQKAGEIRGQILNSALTAAKEAGQSGINTQAEVDRLREGLPDFDYSSPEAFRKSSQRIADYYADWSKGFRQKVAGAAAYGGQIPSGSGGNPGTPRTAAQGYNAPQASVQQAPATPSIPQGWSVKVK